MDRSMEDADIDSAAADPPLIPLAGAAVGTLLMIGGFLWLVASLFVTVPIPVGSPLLAILLGIGGFVVSMIAWNPAVW